MNQLQPDRIYGGEINPQHLDYFALPIYEHFNGKPFHVFMISQQWNTAKILAELKSKVIRSRESFDPRLPESPRGFGPSLILKLHNVFCLIEPARLTCYASSPETAKSKALQLMKRITPPVEPQLPHFHVLSFRANTLEIQAVKLAKPFKLSEVELQWHYGVDATKFERYLIESWSSNVAGITIFRGPPGTGKTSYIRHLISTLGPKHRFYYLPLNAVRHLSSPEMVDSWLRLDRMPGERKKIAVLEDAEELLMERGVDDQGKVASLLNMGDGLMSDCLRMHLICTVNCPLDKLDPAIIRPGRLVAVREFRRLDKKRAECIAASRKITLPTQDDYSLAEIYRGNAWRDDEQAGRKIGFAVSGRPLGT